MGPITFVYDTVRHYVTDLPETSCPGPIRSKLIGYARSRNLKALCEAQELYDPACHGIDVFRTLRQVEALFKKNKIFSDESICMLAAYESFLKSEELCRITNKRLDYYYAQPGRLDPDLSLWVSRMQVLIADLLSGGPRDTEDGFARFLEEIPHRIRVTSGATSTLSRRDALPHLKLGKVVACTPSAVPYLEALKSLWGYRAPRLETVVDNRVEFVPKNWKTHRTIACEPTGNVPLQLAFDAYVKDRLHRWGLNLHDQFRNQELAREGSMYGTYATIDLSAASDTLAYNVVHLLFPSRWARYLSDVRSPCHRDAFGNMKPYAKFSSMGNGTTFALETLVFASACLAVGCEPGRFVVYGDDIIVPTDLAGKLEKLLTYLGFRLNRAKSYTAGPFRESCGADWFNGVDVTPFYLRMVDSRKAVQCHNVNGLASLIVKEGNLSKFLVSYVRDNKLPLVPFNYSTTSGVHVDASTAYDQGLLRRGRTAKDGRGPRWTPQFKAYTLREDSEALADSRSLFLWFLESCTYTTKSRFGRNYANRQNFHSWLLEHGLLIDRDAKDRSTSEVSTLRHKYVREWVDWYPPVTATPVHLYWWAELLTRP